MRVLEQFILDIPYLFLKNIPYAWLAAVFFWSWPPVFSSVFLPIVLLVPTDNEKFLAAPAGHEIAAQATFTSPV
jgi:hypothetical protein